jgi:hypothetical protein
MRRHRRHLDEGQRSVVAAKIANLENGQHTSSANLQSSPVTQSAAASMLNVGRASVQHASIEAPSQAEAASPAPIPAPRQQGVA